MHSIMVIVDADTNVTRLTIVLCVKLSFVAESKRYCGVKEYNVMTFSTN